MDLQAVLARNLAAVAARVAAACARAGRDPAGVTLIGVTKSVDARVTDALIAQGVRHIGENRQQDAAAKFAQMDALEGVTRHFIGPLQRNKVKRVLELFDVIHSVDSLALASEIEKRAIELGRKEVPVFLEVNVAAEPQKHGFAPDDLHAALQQCAVEFSRMKVIGLMCMAPHLDDPQAARPHFRRLRELANVPISCGLSQPLPCLSMGMSGDFEVAIEEGATHVRVGTALFDGLSPR
ncbi:MAG: YggS family pyridoxal phosphate-dependent enzyme [Planctomycetes bacterium]|nr:YggS family pyridoxal phosphate-dependent enzyme [Planctomycetota bacterium]